MKTQLELLVEVLKERADHAAEIVAVDEVSKASRHAAVMETFFAVGAATRAAELDKSDRAKRVENLLSQLEETKVHLTGAYTNGWNLAIDTAIKIIKEQEAK